MKSPIVNGKKDVAVAVGRPRHARGRLTAMAGVLLGVILLGSCSAAGQPGAGGPPAPVGSAAKGGSAAGALAQENGSSVITLPIQAYMLTVPQNAQWTQAMWLLVQRCMRSYGYISYTAPSNSPADGITWLEGLYGMNYRYGRPATLADAERFGYGVSYTGQLAAPIVGQGLPGVTPQPGQQPSSGAQLSTAEEELLKGVIPGGGQVALPKGVHVPVGGCAGQAQRELGNLTANSMEVVDQINRTSAAEAQVNPKVQEVWAQWSSCMAAKGYPGLASPFNVAESHPSWAEIGHIPSAAEVRQAVTDYNCRVSVHLVQVWEGVETQIEDTLINENAPALASIQQLEQLALRNAARVLASN
jgi:hypothetical protein